MKATVPAARVTRPMQLISFDTLALALFLVLGSLLAVAGGAATSVLFFGLLLTFALLLLAGRRLHATKPKQLAGAAYK